MLNQQIISPQIEPLEYSNTVEEALNRMTDNELPALPIVKDGMYEGLLYEENLLDADPKDSLESFQFDLLPFSVKADDHFLSAARLSADHRLKIIPVVTNDKEYFGIILQEGLMNQFNKLNGVQDGGALLVLSMNPVDYSISQLSKLVETNDAFIRQLNTYLDELTGLLIVTIRINKEEVSDIIATLQRYDYQIIFHAGEEQYENELRRNYHHLMNFLEM